MNHVEFWRRGVPGRGTVHTRALRLDGAWVVGRTARKPCGWRRVNEGGGRRGWSRWYTASWASGRTWAFSSAGWGPWVLWQRRGGTRPRALRCDFATARRTDCGATGRSRGTRGEPTTLVQVGDVGAELDGGRGGGISGWVLEGFFTEASGIGLVVG